MFANAGISVRNRVVGFDPAYAQLLRERALDRRALRGDLLHVAGAHLLQEERAVRDADARRRLRRPRAEVEVEGEQREREEDPAAAQAEARQLRGRRRASRAAPAAGSRSCSRSSRGAFTAAGSRCSRTVKTNAVSAVGGREARRECPALGASRRHRRPSASRMGACPIAPTRQCWRLGAKLVARPVITDVYPGSHGE